MKIFALKSCDTCRKAIKELDGAGRDYALTDVRADGMSREDIARIVGAVGFEKALNRRSTTWRALDDAAKDGLDAVKACALIERHPTLMKRPAIDDGETVTVGWDKAARERWL